MADHADRERECPVCHGRGYLRCACWPGDCICGEDDRDCENCFGIGWIDTDDYYPEAIIMTEQEYLAAIDREAVRRGYMPVGDSLVAATGPEPWLEAWHDDPTLTPEEQVAEEILAAAESV